MYNSSNNVIFTISFLLLTVYSVSALAKEMVHNSTIAIKNPSAISSERQKELKYMVQQDCGSCHGMRLKGGLGPSLLPERVSVLPKGYLIEAVTHGRTGTPMPPWEPILTDSEIAWIVEQLQSGHLAQKK